MTGHKALLAQVRQDFFDKTANEKILGCRTWKEYCKNVLHYSDSHMRNLIAGQNPATAKHDGTANRKSSEAPQCSDSETVSLGKPGYEVTVKELLAWRDGLDEELLNHLSIYGSHPKINAGAVDLNFERITPAVAKKLAEYFISLKLCSELLREMQRRNQPMAIAVGVTADPIPEPPPPAKHKTHAVGKNALLRQFRAARLEAKKLTNTSEYIASIDDNVEFPHEMGERLDKAMATMGAARTELESLGVKFHSPAEAAKERRARRR